MTNTNNLSRLGYREIDTLSDLLKAYIKDKWNSEKDRLNYNINWEFNPNSGDVFLIDEDYNVAMLNYDGKLENWLSCSNCGEEGFRSEVDFKNDFICKKCYEKEKEND